MLILSITVWCFVTASIYLLMKEMKKVFFGDKFKQEKCKIIFMQATMTMSVFLLTVLNVMLLYNSVVE